MYNVIIIWNYGRMLACGPIICVRSTDALHMLIGCIFFVIHHAYIVINFQINSSTRRIAGYGLTDGEGVERLWSFLRPLAKLTKEMTPDHRTELLNDALIHFSKRKTAGLGWYSWYKDNKCSVSHYYCYFISLI